MGVSGGMMKMESEVISARECRLAEVSDFNGKEKLVEGIVDFFTVAKLNGYDLEICRYYRSADEKKIKFHLHIDLTNDTERHLIRIYVTDNKLVKMIYVGTEKSNWDSHFEDFLGVATDSDDGRINIQVIDTEHMVSLFHLIKGYV